MNMETYQPNRDYARMTGLLYVVFAALGIFGFFYVEQRLYGTNDMAVAAQRLLTNEGLFRIDKALAMLSGVLFIVIVLRLFRLLKPVNEHLARFMVLLVATGIPVTIVVYALQLTALHLFKGHLLPDTGQQTTQAFAMTLLKIGNNASQLLTLFWGWWLFPLGALVYQSRFLPRWLGVLLVINGVGYLVQCFSFLLFPAQLKTIVTFIFPTYFLGEIPFMFWLMIKGVKKLEN